MKQIVRFGFPRLARLVAPAVCLAASALLPFGSVHAAPAAPIEIVAAENFYGDIARQIGGPAVKVSSILENPDQDPHLFEASPSIARNIAGARILVSSGAGYDPWFAALAKNSAGKGQVNIVVADLSGHKDGDNPHIWYDLVAVRAYADKLTATLSDIDPADASAFKSRLAAFEKSLDGLDTRIAAFKQHYAGTPVTATEPVFGYMFAALGLTVRNDRFQIAIMNDTEPAASDVAAFEDDLRNHKVALLLYNAQTSGPVTERLQKLAKASKIPVVPATETEPADMKFQNWLGGELDRVEAALAVSRPVKAAN